MLSEVATSINQKLAEMNYRQQLMNTFEEMQRIPAENRPRALKFPSKVNQTTVAYDAHTVRRLTLTDTTQGELFMLHGGAFILPASTAFNQVAVAFMKMGYAVTIPDYPLAPAKIADIRPWILDVYQDWVAQNPTVGHYMWGDSAGANIAFRLLLDIRDAALIRPDATAFVSLCPDTTFSVPEKAAHADLVLDPNRMRRMQNNAAYQQFDFMQLADYSSLGRLRFDSGGNECVASAVSEIAQACEVAGGNEVAISVHPELVHDYPMWQAMPEAKQTLQDIHLFFQRK
ncbi:alpha/beta hydrolase [Weissella viridescens]|uniref:Alpha/beta hydrolase n=1 Tax=Weissella viridescens TaxID=1629 RepID=A0A3P2RAT6_WEIVI|nr:alpha/beta hydrolase [Weissella viridescens]RRG17643.1 alpha/beta hydrolase [Weissella viridescens]